MNEDKLTLKMLRRLAKLDALEAHGVDNWEFYDDALADWRKENRLHELAEGFAVDLHELLTEAKIDEPAGQGAGYAVIFPDQSLESLFLDYAKKLLENES